MTDSAIIARVQALLKPHNPCGIAKDPTTGFTRCNGRANGYRPCCGGCPHLSAGGCTVAAHACRIYLCDSAWRIVPSEVRQQVVTLLRQYKGAFYFRHDQSTYGRRGTDEAWEVDATDRWLAQESPARRQTLIERDRAGVPNKRLSRYTWAGLY